MPDETVVSTEFSRYVLIEKLNNLSFPTYDTSQSLRMWFKDFENQVLYTGVTNMDVCIPQIGRFMPPIVRNLLPSLPSTVKLSWKLFTEELLLHFGKPEEEENRELLNKLRHCKQQAGESTRLFSAKWQHLQSLLPEKHLTEGQKISLYTKSIFNQGLRNTLVTFVELGQINTVSDVIKKAIDIHYLKKLFILNRLLHISY